MAEIESMDGEISLDRTEPVDGLAGFEQDFNRRTAGIKELGTSVYRECWDEFYRWEPGECQQLIVALPPAPSDSADFEVLIDLLSSDGGAWDRGFTMDVDPPTSETVVTVTIYDRDDSFSQALISFDEVAVIAAFEPHPTYESCPPTSKNIACRLDQLTDFAHFIPYADEGFDAKEYVKEYKSLSWQVDFKDPDLEVIQLETARRLHFGHKLSFAEIDDLSLLLPLRTSSCSGLLWDTFQRDVLKWPGTYNPHLPSFTSTFEDDQNGEAQIRLKNDLQVRLGTLLESFCPNLNCVQAACTMHIGTDIYPEIPNIHRSTYEPVRPRLTNQDIRRSEGTRCGEECFRAISDDLADQLCWEDPVDLTTLKTILDISPDLSPCELAVLCRKPCREIYVQRTIIYQDDVISDQAQLQESLKKSRASHRGRKPKKMKDMGHMSFTPRPPCKHKGPCDANSGCSCFRQKHHCQRNCQCGSECERRWKGCNCQKKPTRKPCGSKCKCVMAERECDVDLCRPCHARAGSHNGCQNVKIQQGISKGIEIKRGAFGLGAFATTAIFPNDYLGEYVGELFTKDNTPDITAATFRGLNYNFSTNETWIIDAAQVGNNTRYANHAKSPKANCEARIRLVNGEHRIGFFAVGQEILLDYGDDYWLYHPKLGD